jgi:hypothetical protein
VIWSVAQRLLSWGVRRIGLQRLLALVLLLVALAGVALGLANLVRGLDSWLMLTLAAISLLIGWGLATLPWRGWTASLVGVASGLVITFLRVGRLGGILVALLRASAGLLWELSQWLLLAGILHQWPGPPPLDWTAISSALTDLWAGATALALRAWDWALTLAIGDSVFDPVAATLVWALAVWLVSAWAGWMVRRNSRPLLGLTPAGVLMTAALSYAGGKAYALLVLLGATLLLLALTAYDSILRRWQLAGTDFPEVGGEVAAVVGFLSAALVLAAWLTPSLSVQRVIEFVQNLGVEQGDGVEAAADSLGLAQRPGEGPSSTAGRTSAGELPRHHLLGAGPELGEDVVLVVMTGDLPPRLSAHELEWMRVTVPRYYWRGVTYDRYTHGGWFASEAEMVEYAAGEPAAAYTSTDTRKMVRQGVQAVGDTGGMLYAAGTLVVADQDYAVAWRSNGDAFAATIKAETYQAESLVSMVTEEQLRSAGGNYPDWVRERYLALPDGIPQRVLSLARDLTATGLTPYDRARAIEVYLRDIPYTLNVPVPPMGRDVVDYFLFDLRKGYCDYYATAMVVLARAAGIPARYVAGYASGRYDSYDARYVVTEADAHAWVEVYFPDYGWVEFEPTSGRLPIDRSGEAAPFGKSEPIGVMRPAASMWARLGQGWRSLLAGVLVLLALTGLVWWAADDLWLRRMRPAEVVATIYGRLRRYGRHLAVPMQAGDTPYEFFASLTEWAARLARERRWGSVLAPAAREVRRLIEFYVLASYGPHSPSALDRSRAIEAWKRARWRLWLARLMGKPG